jgi:argininosuccinate synthase
MSDTVKKAVLAYSGGIDTSVILLDAALEPK